MSLTEAQMTRLDETPTIRNFPAVMSFTPIRAGEVRSRPARIPPPQDDLYVKARREARRRQLEHFARLVERDEL